MGFTDPNYWKQSPPPQTGDMNNERYLNQKATLELPGAQAPQELTVADGRISPTRAAIVVDTEGGGAADDLDVINTAVGSGTETLHNGMLITLRAKDPARVVTVKNSAAANGINTADGNDIILSTAWELTLRLVSGRWYEVQGRASAQAAAAQADAATALERTAPATTTSRGIARVATLADIGPDAVIENGPAFLAAGDVVSVIEKWRFIVGEFYYFRHPTLKPGFAPLQGGLISGVYQGKNITEYPIWDYLQTAEGQLLCKTEAEWQSMTQAIWHTNADGTTVGWDGIGGAPFYVQNLGAGTLRMPDLRGMYAEAAGFDSLGAGGVRGDGIPQITGLVESIRLATNAVASGAFYISGTSSLAASGTTMTTGNLAFNSSRVVQTSTSVHVRSWGALACCYLGQVI